MAQVVGGFDDATRLVEACGGDFADEVGDVLEAHEGADVADQVYVHGGGELPSLELTGIHVIDGDLRVGQVHSNPDEGLFGDNGTILIVTGNLDVDVLECEGLYVGGDVRVREHALLNTGEQGGLINGSLNANLVLVEQADGEVRGESVVDRFVDIREHEDLEWQLWTDQSARLSAASERAVPVQAGPGWGFYL